MFSATNWTAVTGFSLGIPSYTIPTNVVSGFMLRITSRDNDAHHVQTVIVQGQKMSTCGWDGQDDIAVDSNSIDLQTMWIPVIAGPTSLTIDQRRALPWVGSAWNQYHNVIDKLLQLRACRKKPRTRHSRRNYNDGDV